MLGLLWALLLGSWGQPGFPIPAVASQETGPALEDLHYRVDLWIWQDAARVRVTLKSLGSGRYLAEVTGEAQGLAGLVSGHRQDRYQTEMVYRQGQLRPLIYREESRRRGKSRLKEYRFDYARARLELWQGQDARELKLKWHTSLKEPIYDPLSAFYNGRLGFLGPIREGETLRVAGIPYPKPEEIQVRIGPETQEGRQVMVALANPAFEKQKGLAFVLFDANRVPTRLWSRVLHFGKILGQLLPDSKPLKGPLPEGSAAGWPPPPNGCVPE